MPFPKLLIIPPIIAHRGASLQAPENTLAAFRKAKELGIHWVEFDVMLTADDEVVVIHDETLERTTNGKGAIGMLTYSELQALDAGSWFHSDYCNEKVSTFRAVMDFLNEHEMSANIEIKAQKGREEITVEKVLAVLESMSHHYFTPPLISSFSLKTLQQVRQHSADSLIGFLMHQWQKDWQVICDDLQASAVDVNHTILTPHKVKEMKDSQRVVLAYTVNDPVRAQELYSWGVDAVFSDCPQQMLVTITLRR
jgi:glycerophosphoryl diester phosphodiesterase